MLQPNHANQLRPKLKLLHQKLRSHQQQSLHQSQRQLHRLQLHEIHLHHLLLYQLLQHLLQKVQCLLRQIVSCNLG